MKRFLLVVTAVGVASVWIGVVAAFATGNPTGQWASPSAVQRSFIGHPFEVMTCSPACNVFNGQIIGDTSTFRIGVVSARVRGIGPSKIVNGQRRYQSFEGRVCGLDYIDGGARVGAHFAWFTQRPHKKTAQFEDSGAAYAADWTHRGFVPFAQDGC